MSWRLALDLLCSRPEKLICCWKRNNFPRFIDCKYFIYSPKKVSILIAKNVYKECAGLCPLWFGENKLKHPWKPREFRCPLVQFTSGRDGEVPQAHPSCNVLTQPSLQGELFRPHSELRKYRWNMNTEHSGTISDTPACVQHKPGALSAFSFLPVGSK